MWNNSDSDVHRNVPKINIHKIRFFFFFLSPYLILSFSVQLVWYIYTIKTQEPHQVVIPIDTHTHTHDDYVVRDFFFILLLFRGVEYSLPCRWYWALETSSCQKNSAAAVPHAWPPLFLRSIFYRILFLLFSICAAFFYWVTVWYGMRGATFYVDWIQ